MKPDFSPQSLFIALGNSGTLLFFLQCVSLPLFSFLLTLIWSPSNDQNLMEGLINSIVQRHFDICPKGVEAFFFFFKMPSRVSCHLSEKQTRLCCEKMLKGEKNVCVKKNRDVRRGERMQSWRNSQTSTGSLRYLNLKDIEKHSLNWYIFLLA